MIRILCFRNRQRVCCVNARLLRLITLHLLDKYLNVSGFELAIHLVASPEMARVNELFLQHDGPTDVITFDYVGVVPTSGTNIWRQKPILPNESAPLGGVRRYLYGELFVCLNEALAQSRRFRTTWQRELVRYIIHGLLHLCDHHDLQPASRRKMKREENRLLRELAKEFALAQVGKRQKF